MRVLPLAAVQEAPCPADAPLSRFAEHVGSLVAAFPQVRMIVYPELHLFGTEGPLKRELLLDVAEPLSGPRMAALAELAGDLGVWLVPGSVCERGPGGQVFNTAVTFSPEGRLAASYRKVFPWRPYEPFEAGDRFVTFDLPGVGRAGFSVCYDAWFPEVTRHLAWMGAEVVLNLVKTTTCDRTQEVILTRANAIVNQVFVVSVNCAGPVGTGRSLVVDPEGIVRAETVGAERTVLTDVLDLDHVPRVRQYGTVGLTRPWDQFRPGDPALPLPLYGGGIDPGRWHPSQRPPEEAQPVGERAESTGRLARAPDGGTL